MWWRPMFLSFFVTLNLGSEDERNFVMIDQGPVRGLRESESIYAFYSIPYATAPKGEDKFKSPLPPPNWTEPFEAIDKGIICPQPDFGSEIFGEAKTMQEDCLIVNVYVPDTEEEKLSVIVYIHGGAFQVGAGDRRKAKNLMETKKIIMVTFNYRLGINGFLCLGTKDIPGNAGMKDIVAMLRWLKKNIASFGGNPEDITVSGYSAGAVAADLLIVSKSAKGLFKKVIIESGSSVAEYAIQLKPLDVAKTYAKTLNSTINVDDILELEKFYKTLSYHELNEETYVHRKDSNFVFVPCIERDVGQDMFLHDAPINILKKGDYTKVPMLYGFTDMEGLIRLSFFDLWKSTINENFTNFLPLDLMFDNEHEKQKVAEKVKKYYFGDRSIESPNSILAYIFYITDVMFASPALRSVSLNVAGGNRQMYLYHYSFTDETDPYVPYTQVRGANHCAQSLAIFDDSEPKTITSKFATLRKVMRRMWYSFITTSEPIPRKLHFPISWPPTTVNRSPHMFFGQVVERRDILLEKRGSLWDNLYDKYYRQPEPPPPLESSSTISNVIL